MKKSLLLLSVAALASVANAQVVVNLATSEELEAAGLTSTKVDTEAKTILESEVGSFGLAYQDNWGTTTTYKTYRNIKVNGESVVLGSGAVGNSNPTFVSFQAGAPSAGAVFKIHALKNGYMTVFTKMNPNKQYLVYENTTDGAIVYTVGWANGEQKIHYTMPNDGEGYINFEASDASQYLIVATKQKKNADGVLLWKNKVTGEIVAAAKNPTVKDDPNMQFTGDMEDIPGENKPAMPWNVAGFEKAPGESTGFLVFPVYEDSDYYFSALGSKAACGGFVYTEVDPQIVFEETVEEVKDGDGNVTGTKTYPEVVFEPLMDPSAVEAVEAVDNADAPVYNMMGIRVNSDAKGILIQNGKKFIRK